MQIFFIPRIFQLLTPPKILEEKLPWEAVKIFLNKCEASGLPVFVIEPSLLRAIRNQNVRRIELWNTAKQTIVTFGVISPGLDQLHLVMSAMKREDFDYWEKNDPDPRGLSLTARRSYRVVPSHYLLWMPIETNLPMLIHIVVFYKRGEYLWQAPIQDVDHVPPFSMDYVPFTKTAAAFKK
ncbi:fukutin [Plakobranchus ocellatus]|uniref:Fukutin n=1 Tax=Plakobranchus ocellatus TaxID=259542 RepID=A0AAV3ZSH3_9GAST|nr:fukutin [Plakobranchus ocellatus]